MAEEVGRAILGDEEEKTPFYKKPENIITGLVLAAALAQPRGRGLSGGQDALSKAAGALQFRGELGRGLEDRKIQAEQRKTQQENVIAEQETHKTQAETQRTGVEVQREGVGVDRRQIAEIERHNKQMEQIEMAKARLVAATQSGSSEALTRGLSDIATKGMEADNKLLSDFQMSIQGMQDPKQITAANEQLKRDLARNASITAAHSNALQQRVANPDTPYVVTLDKDGFARVVPLTAVPQPTPTESTPEPLPVPGAEPPAVPKAVLNIEQATAAVGEQRAAEAKKKEGEMATERRISLTARDLKDRTEADLVALSKQNLDPESKRAVARALDAKRARPLKEK